MAERLMQTQAAPPPVLAGEPVEKLCLFFHGKKAGRVIGGLEAIASVSGKGFAHPLGKLASDHLGYMSFNLSGLNQALGRSQSAKQMVQSSSEPPNIGFLLGHFAIKIRIKSPVNLEFDILEHRYGFIRNALLVDIDLDIPDLPEERRASGGLISMQSPDLTDWVVSPSSFSLNPAYLIGDDGCERMFPANFATSEFRFFQVIRGEPLDVGRRDREPVEVRSGAALEYATTWQPLGHTLGQIIYSLPLAPGETVKIAVLEWARKSVDSRTEDLTVAEQLAHNTHRDRMISETVEAGLSEWQRGGNFMGGNSGAAGVSYGVPIFGAAAGNAHSFGGGYSTSSGDRDVTASTTQQVSDAFAQASSSFRELRSTIVIQSDQREDVKAETRVIANHNHSHALTMLYYEVLRHFKVTTEYRALRHCLLVRYDAPSFASFEEIWDHQFILKQVLLDPSLLGCFDAVEKYRCARFAADRIPTARSQKDWLISTLNARFLTGTNGGDGDVRIDLALHDNRVINLLYSASQDDIDKTKMDDSDNDFGAGELDVRNDLILRNFETVRWEEVKTVIVSYRGSRSGIGSWSLQRFRLEAPTPDGIAVLFDGDVAMNLNPSEPNEPASGLNDHGDRNPARLPARPPQDIPPPNIAQLAYDALNDAEKCCVEKLRLHLINNRSSYQRILWLSEDANRRAIRFAEIEVDGRPLLDLVENRPMDVYGDYVVFPSHHKELRLEVSPAKVERLITLPTRGVFGEAKLGNCNASEVIDNTRFWDWQTSPITETPPEIDPLETGSRNVTQDLTPTAFPNSIVNIVNPPNAPDPTGLASALTLLGQSNVFRDMSMTSEVNDLLKKLSDNSISIAEAATQARGIRERQQDGSGSAAPTPQQNGAGGAGSSGGGSAVPQKTPTEREQDETDVAEKKLKVAKDNLTPKQQEKVREKVTEDMTKVKAKLYLTLQNPSGNIIDVLEPADFDIDGDYQGKMNFVGGTADAETTVRAGNFHIKLHGEVRTIAGREYFAKLPGMSEQAGRFYFESNCFFEIAPGKSFAHLAGILVTKALQVEVTVDLEGKISVAPAIEFAALKVLKISAGATIDLGGNAGVKTSYTIECITGLALSQTPSQP